METLGRTMRFHVGAGQFPFPVVRDTFYTPFIILGLPALLLKILLKTPSIVPVKPLKKSYLEGKAHYFLL